MVMIVLAWGSPTYGCHFSNGCPSHWENTIWKTKSLASTIDDELFFCACPHWIWWWWRWWWWWGDLGPPLSREETNPSQDGVWPIRPKSVKPKIQIVWTPKQNPYVFDVLLFSQKLGETHGQAHHLHTKTFTVLQSMVKSLEELHAAQSGWFAETLSTVGDFKFLALIIHP